MKGLTLTAAAAVLALSACSAVTNETRTPAVVEGGFYDGERYELRTQEINGPSGPFEQTRVVYRGFAETCRPESENDCERTARALIEAYDDLIF